MRWLLLIVSLCVAARLACCQDTRWSNMAASVHHEVVKGEYDPGRVARKDEGSPGAGYQALHAIHNPGDRVLHDPAGSYRSNRAIDDSRSTEANAKTNQQPGQSSNLPKPTSKTEAKPRKYKNVTLGDGICQSIDIRNTVGYFAMMTGCRVIEGFLQIVLLENASDKEFEDLQFPELREITGYLLLYHVRGLKSIGRLFPNLEVIRGNILLADYAFMVYEMENLQEIGLTKLTEISRGSVRIEKNPCLCYTNTLNWDLIVAAGENVIKENGEEVTCPGCNHCPDSLCWSAQWCQMTEKPMCHEQCLGECLGPSDSDCYVCKHYRRDGKCVETCPSHLNAYLARRCIARDECYQMNRLKRVFYFLEEGQSWRPFNGTCVTHCPDGFEDTRDEHNMTTCRACENRCQKISHGGLIHHISDAQRFRGVTIVKGALDFQIRNGNPNIMNELSDAFSLVEEITEYVKITHSFPITSLGFFKKLKVIKGERLDLNNASLTVVDNPNLSGLFPPERNIRIERGRLFFHYNPKLCFSKIVELSKMVNITNFTDMEVQPESNGEKVACNIVGINITVRHLGPDYADLVWEYSDKPPEGQQLLSYLLHYVETENRNISYETNACGGSNTWQVIDVDIPKRNTTVSKHIANLKPYTMYGVYVKTFMAKSMNFLSNRVGQSEIIFFRTKSTVPSPPVNVMSFTLSDTEILVKWESPLYPNGPIGYYMLSSTMLSDEEGLISKRDFCNNTLQYEPEVEDTSPHVTVRTPVINIGSCCSKNAATSLVTSKKFEIYCHENTSISYMSPGWKDYCVDNSYNSMDKKFYELANHLSAAQSERQPSKTDIKRSFEGYADETTVIYNVTGQNNSYVMRNLRHYSRYIISVAACGIKMGEAHMCSSIQYTNSRTKKRDHADDVRSVRARVTNNTIMEVTWDMVKDPNALTVSYTVEYTNLDVTNAKKITECIPWIGRRESASTYLVRNLSPGKYSLRVRSTSLAGDGYFSKAIYFTINAKNGIPVTLISCLILAILFTTIVVIFFFLRKQHKKKRQERLIASVNPDYMETKYVIDEWEVPRESVEILEELGLGNFGMVYRGYFDKTIPVAIKTISSTANQREKNEFLNEASVMKNFSTYHIIKLLGVVSIDSPPFVVMELMENGDLKTYLRGIRDTHLVPNPCRMLRMAAEIADGMAYLESKKFVHRDLAARNCMVAKDLVCKIGDFGMARDVYETDYYKIGRKGLLPIRWMAPENLSDGVFTSDSDVWSYGVVLYEILTLAEMPYQGFSNEEVLSHVLHKGTLTAPRGCPENMQKIMEKCFKWRPNDRPTFMEIVTELEPFLSQDFCERSFYHTTEGIDSRNSGAKKPYHHAAPIRFHWGNETARWVKEFEDNVTLLDQTKAGTSRGRIFKNGFQHFGNVANMEDVPFDR